jgi:hypothetical protein
LPAPELVTARWLLLTASTVAAGCEPLFVSAICESAHHHTEPSGSLDAIYSPSPHFPACLLVRCEERFYTPQFITVACKQYEK